MTWKEGSLLACIAWSLGCQGAPQPNFEQASAEQAQPSTTETVDGYSVIKAKLGDGTETPVQVQAPAGTQVIRRPDPDPHGGNFPLAEALQGLPTEGRLTATIRTSMGEIRCDLFDDKAPNTVANFVGLARGLRKYFDTREGAWIARKYFDGTMFHRVIPEFMIQGGDYMNTGAGFTGYVIPDELHPTLKHDRPGQLCMANRGPNTNATQFFITEVATPHLDGSYTIFGQCEPVDLVYRIARVPQGPQNRPLTPVTIDRVEVTRRKGAPIAAAKASIPSAPASIPPGRNPSSAPPASLPHGVHVANKVGGATPAAPAEKTAEQ